MSSFALDRERPAASWVVLGRRLVASGAGPALLAVVMTVICEVAGFRGPDVAAQTYRVIEVRHHGLGILDPGWYSGMYLPSYGVVFPVLGALTGIWVTAGLAAATAAACFDVIVRDVLGRRPMGSWYFAVATTVEVAIGQLPFLTGEALGLAAVLAVVRRRAGLGVVLGVLVALSSPVAGAFLALALVAWGLSEVSRRAVLIGVGLVPLVVVAAVEVLFPGSGWFPFTAGNAIAVLLLCTVMLGPPVLLPRAVRMAAALYGAVTVVLFVAPTMMGNNDMRLGAYIGVPVLLCYGAPRLRRPTGQSVRAVGAWSLRLFAIVGWVVWAWAPAVSALPGGTTAQASTESFYTPLLAELKARTSQPARVEVAPTLDHWESVWVAPVFPLARGWERQLDMGQNPLFYGSQPLTAAAYRSWLLAEGVSFVALPAAPLDHAATAEAALLRSGRTPGLEMVWESPTWTLWRVLGSPGLVSGPAELVAVAPDRVSLAVTEPGIVTVRVRWSEYWSVPDGAGCLSKSPAGWTVVHAAHPGALTMSASMLHPSVDCAKD